MNDPDDNPFWGEPIPTDLWEDMDKLNTLYEELCWDIDDYLEFVPDYKNNRILIVNRTMEEEGD